MASKKNSNFKERLSLRLLLVVSVFLYSLFVVSGAFLSIERPIGPLENSEELTFAVIFFTSALVSWGISRTSRRLERIFDGMGSFFAAAAVISSMFCNGWEEGPTFILSGAVLAVAFAGASHFVPEHRSDWTPTVLGGGFGIATQTVGIFGYLEFLEQGGTTTLALVIFFIASFLFATALLYTEGSLANILKAQTVVAIGLSSYILLILVGEEVAPSGLESSGATAGIFLLGAGLFLGGIGLGWLGYRESSA